MKKSASSNKRKRRSIQKRLGAQWVALLGLVVATLGMAVGFAAFTKTLNISGTASVEKAVWSVRWDPDSFYEEGYVDTTAHSISDSSMTFQCTLSLGDVCGFDLDAINEGTFDAKLTSFTISGPTTAQQQYIAVRMFSYNGSSNLSWSTDGTYGTKINYGTTNVSSSNLRVSKMSGSTAGRLWFEIDAAFIQAENVNNMPTTNQNISITISFKFDQV
ncbi:hypothetical protein IJJ54_01575 [Candidatus Saccharibacteria bacterium]|nr:hypothetical protein [Candidatus Saccharibacteria bacterium]